MSNVSQCSSFFGHRFQPRYDQSAAQMPAGREFQLKNSTETLSEILECFRSKTYVYDICVKCGCTVKR